jgi:hypothetical protein
MANTTMHDASNDNITHTLPHNNMYVISYHETNHTNGWHMGSCTARLTGMNPSTQIHPVNWDIEIGSDQDSIECYTVMKVKEGPMYHAHPNYCNEGPWQDWANISFGQDEQGVFQMVPSRILLFYISITLLMTMESIAMKSELLCRHAITKWVAITLGGYIWKRRTALCSRWQLSMKHWSS